MWVICWLEWTNKWLGFNFLTRRADKPRTYTVHAKSFRSISEEFFLCWSHHMLLKQYTIAQYQRALCSQWHTLVKVSDLKRNAWFMNKLESWSEDHSRPVISINFPGLHMSGDCCEPQPRARGASGSLVVKDIKCEMAFPLCIFPFSPSHIHPFLPF